MYCTYVLTIACLKMFLRSRQALFFSLFMPFMILLIFGSVDFNKTSKLRIGLVTHTPSPLAARFVKGLRSADFLKTEEGTLDAELAELEHGNRTAVLDLPDNLFVPGKAAEAGQIAVYVNDGKPLESQMALSVLNQFANRAMLSAMNLPPLFTIKQHNARNLRYNRRHARPRTTRQPDPARPRRG